MSDVPAPVVVPYAAFLERRASCFGIVAECAATATFSAPTPPPFSEPLDDGQSHPAREPHASRRGLEP
jgi:hypothetical protein